MGEILEENVRLEVDMILLCEQIDKILLTFTEREAKIIRLRFYEKMTLRSVGIVLGIHQETVRKIESKALRKFRHPARAKLLVEWLSVREQEERMKK